MDERTIGHLHRLKELDAMILRHAETGSMLIKEHAEVSMIQSQIRFVRTLYDSRETVLRELHKLGYSEGDIYGYGKYGRKGIYHDDGIAAGDRAAAAAGASG